MYDSLINIFTTAVYGQMHAYILFLIQEKSADLHSVGTVP